jgi:hypothetical protein
MIVVNVIYRSGKVMAFLVPAEMLSADFQVLAEQVGGKIRRLAYP